MKQISSPPETPTGLSAKKQKDLALLRQGEKLKESDRRQLIYALFKYCGWPRYQIAKEVGASQRYVSKCVEAQNTTALRKMAIPHRGRSSVLTNEQLLEIKKRMKEASLTPPEVRTFIQDGFGLTFSKGYVHKIIKKARAAKQPKRRSSSPVNPISREILSGPVEPVERRRFKEYREHQPESDRVVTSAPSHYIVEQYVCDELAFELSTCDENVIFRGCRSVKRYVCRPFMG